MNVQKISAWVLSFFLIIILSIISGCAGGGEDEPASSDSSDTAAYTQADLAGTWRLSKLADDHWMRGTFTVDTSGQVACVAYEDSNGTTTCPSDFNLIWTAATDGAITESGTSAESSIHMTMNSTLQLIAGTGSGSDGSQQMRVAQREGSGYSVSDVQDKSFVFHQLSAGANQVWRYGSGSTNASGLITMMSETGPSDTALTLTGLTISSDVNGQVTLTGGGISAFSGYLMNDKKTIVGTYTSGSDYRLIVIQITGRTYPAGNLPQGSWRAHGLVVGPSSYAPFWLRYKASVDSSGTINFGSFSSSQPLAALVVPTSADATVTSSGEISSSTMAMHGQAGDDSTFMVSTTTPYTDCYSLTVYTDFP